MEYFHGNLDENISKVQTILGDSDDLVIRQIQFGTEWQMRAVIMYVDGMADTVSIQNFLLETLMVDFPKTILARGIAESDDVLLVLKESVLTVGDIQQIRDFDSLFTFLLSGYAILLLDGYDQGLSIGVAGWEERGVSEPSNETVIRGPREGFTENLRTNTALIRRRIKDPRLWVEIHRIGSVTKTDVAITYISGIANDKIITEVRARLDRIRIDGIMESGYIEEFIRDETFTPFPTMNNTERADVAVAELLEGRVIIMVDGSPFVLVLPALFVSFFQAAEDYYQRADISTLIRGLRFVSFFIALLGPSLYIAITTFHQEMLPTQLLISLAAQREGVPFPAFFEALLMEVTFEILREAGVRMPKAIGQAVSIVGTLVIGTAAVDAGIVSAAMVIVVDPGGFLWHLWDYRRLAIAGSAFVQPPFFRCSVYESTGTHEYSRPKRYSLSLSALDDEDTAPFDQPEKCGPWAKRTFEETKTERTPISFLSDLGQQGVFR